MTQDEQDKMFTDIFNDEMRTLKHDDIKTWSDEEVAEFLKTRVNDLSRLIIETRARLQAVNDEIKWRAK